MVQARRQLGTRHEAEEHRFKEWAVSETMRMAEAVPEHVLNTRPDLLVGAVAAVNVKYVLDIDPFGCKLVKGCLAEKCSADCSSDSGEIEVF